MMKTLKAIVILSAAIGAAGIVLLANGHVVAGPILIGAAGLIDWIACGIPIPARS